MERVTSTRNPRVRALSSLNRSRERRVRGQHLVEGPRAVEEALDAGVVLEIFVTEEALAQLPETDGVTVTEVTEPVLSKLSGTTSPQGIVALARTPVFALETVLAGGFTVVLDGVADPGNAGTILRTADAAGATGAVFVAGADPYGTKAVRAAAGSTYHLPVAVEDGPEVVAATCRAAGHRLVGLDAAGDAALESLAERSDPIAVVLGNEAHGLSATTVALLDQTVAVPIHGRAESLNVAAAAAVALYTVARGRSRT